MRILAAGLGLGAVAFGIVPALFPGWFGRLFGISSADNPTVATAIRSVGVRDVVVGLGLVQAAREDDRKALGRWLLARAACDAGDAVAVGMALAAGARNPRFIGLGALATGAAVVGIAVARTAR
jgi:hypothetical protein